MAGRTPSPPSDTDFWDVPSKGVTPSPPNGSPRSDRTRTPSPIGDNVSYDPAFLRRQEQEEQEIFTLAGLDPSDDLLTTTSTSIPNESSIVQSKLDFFSEDFDPILALRTPWLQPPVPTAKPLGWLEQCQRLLPKGAEDSITQAYVEKLRATRARQDKKNQVARQGRDRVLKICQVNLQHLVLSMKNGLGFLGVWWCNSDTVCVLTRTRNHVRSIIRGELDAADSHMNLLIKNVTETFVYQYDKWKWQKKSTLKKHEPQQSAIVNIQRDEHSENDTTGEAEFHESESDKIPETNQTHNETDGSSECTTDVPMGRVRRVRKRRVRVRELRYRIAVRTFPVLWIHGSTVVWVAGSDEVQFQDGSDQAQLRRYLPSHILQKLDEGYTENKIDNSETEGVKPGSGQHVRNEVFARAKLNSVVTKHIVAREELFAVFQPKPKEQT